MRRGKKMALLLGLLVVLMGGYALLGRMNGTTAVDEQAGSYPLWQEGKTVSALSWTKDGETFSFVMDDGAWTKADDAAFPVNQTAVQNLADKIVGLTADRELTNVTEPADYGLSEPPFTVTAKDETGAEVVYAMGDQTPFEDGYYMSVSGSEAVYVVAGSLTSSFNKTLTQLASMETIPEAADVTRVTVGDTLDITFDAADNAWTDTASGERLGASLAQDVADTAAALSWSELIATDATDEELSAWALDDAQAVKVTLYSGETAQRTLLLGGEGDDGVYARLPDSRMVYTVAAEDAQALFGADIDTLWQREAVLLTAEEIASLAFVWDGGERTMTGADSESAVMTGVVEQLLSLEGTERVALGDAQTVVLSLCLTDTDGGERELVFYAYNVDSYLLAVTDTHGILVPAADVDKLIRQLRQQGQDVR